MTSDAIDAAIHYCSMMLYYETLPEAFQERYGGIVNSKSLTVVALLDILISMKYLDEAVLAKKGYEAKYFGRVLAVNCHELLLNNSKFAINEAIKDHRGKIEIKHIADAINIASKKSNVLFDKHKDNLYEIRCKSLCHRDDMSGLEQIKYIDGLSLDYVANVGSETIDINMDLMELYTKLMDQLMKLPY